MIRLFLVLSLGWLGSLPVITFAETQDTIFVNQANFLTLSDIHFNPFSACDSPGNCQLACDLAVQDVSEWDGLLAAADPSRYPQYGEETNYYLLETMLAAMQTMTQQTPIDYVLVLGDFIAHRFSGKIGLYQQYTQYCDVIPEYEVFVAKLMRFLSIKLETTFTDMPIYPILGNNDSASGNYSIDPGGCFLQQVQQDWLPLIVPEDDAVFSQTFVDGGGYYSVMLAENLKLLVLNSVLFSVNASTPRPWYLWFSKAKRNAYAEEQMAWLTSQLVQAEQQGQQILIAYHVPVGIDIYQSLGFWGKWFWPTLLWRKDLIQQFVELVETYQTVIVAQLGSHLYTDGLYVIGDVDNNPLSYISTTPSISPVYLNNPGFKIYTYQTEPSLILDYSTYYLDISVPDSSVQHEYTYSRMYGDQYIPLTAQTVTDLFHSVGFEQGLSEHAEDFRKYFYVSASNPVIDQHWRNFWCGIQDITDVADYQGCIRRNHH